MFICVFCKEGTPVSISLVVLEEDEDEDEDEEEKFIHKRKSARRKHKGNQSG